MASERNNLISVKFDGSNYAVWKFHFQFFIEGKGLWRYIDGTESKPDESESKKLKQWRIDNAKIISWILGSIDANIGIPMRGFKTAEEMWNYLERVYQQSNLARKFQIEDNIFSYSQGEKKIQEYYAGFMTLWNEYEEVNMGDISTYCCINNLKKLHEERKVMQFLMKLRPEYEVVRANILNRASDPDMDSVLSEILREETRIVTQASLENKRDADATVFFANKSKNKSFPRDFSKIQCHECKEYGHVASHCKKRNQCTYCKKTGHIISECRLKPQRNDKSKPNFRAYQAVAAEPRSDNTAGSSQLKGTEQSSALTDEMKLLVQNTVSSAISSAFSTIGLSGNVSNTHSYLNPIWILDSGASNHMTCANKDFKDKNYTGNNKIVTANGDKLNIVAVHDIHLSTTIPLKLSNVFMVPNLTANLISVGQLIEEGYKLTFSIDGCLIQDLQTGKEKGRARRVGRLFVMDLTKPKGLEFPSCYLSSSLHNNSQKLWHLWHKRLGHPHADKLNKMFSCDYFIIKQMLILLILINHVLHVL